MVQKNKNLTISELAKLANVNIQTIRYYENLGILPEPKRTESGYRSYDADYIQHIKFVKHAQELNFTLEEIKTLVEIKFKPEGLGKEVKDFVEQKIQHINSEIEKLTQIKKSLQEMVSSCSGSMPNSCCPILESIKNG